MNDKNKGRQGTKEGFIPLGIATTRAAVHESNHEKGIKASLVADGNVGSGGASCSSLYHENVLRLTILKHTSSIIRAMFITYAINTEEA